MILRIQYAVCTCACIQAGFFLTHVGTPVSEPLLRSKAQQLYPRIYPNNLESISFKAGTGWLKRFRERHGVRALSLQRESISANTNEIGSFKECFLKLVEEESLTRDQVFNCDETGLYWKLMPTKTLVTSREKQAKGFKNALLGCS